MKRLFLFFFSLYLTLSASFQADELIPQVESFLAENEQLFYQNWSTLQTNTPKGQLARYQMKSQKLKNKRDIWIYTPFNYSPKTFSYPLLIVFDGQAYVSDLIPTPTILDNLIAANQIPPLVAVFVSSIDQPSRNRELPCYPPFATFLTKELLPWVKQHYKITTKPSQIILAGSSYGGLAAAYIATNYPNLFGNVLSQSGAFHFKRMTQDPWLINQIKQTSLLPIHFYLDIGNQETEIGIGEEKINLVSINRQVRDLLQSKSYILYYTEFNGGHEYECWRQTLATGLITLTRAFKFFDDP